MAAVMRRLVCIIRSFERTGYWANAEVRMQNANDNRSVLHFAICILHFAFHHTLKMRCVFSRSSSRARSTACRSV